MGDPISGLLDVPEFVQLSELLVESIPGAKRIEIPEVAHMLSMEVPEIFHQHVSEFIRTKEQSE